MWIVALFECTVRAVEAKLAAPPPTASCTTRLAHWQESISVSSKHYIEARLGLHEKHHRHRVNSERQPKDSLQLWIHQTNLSHLKSSETIDAARSLNNHNTSRVHPSVCQRAGWSAPATLMSIQSLSESLISPVSLAQATSSQHSPGISVTRPLVLQRHPCVTRLYTYQEQTCCQQALLPDGRSSYLKVAKI